MYKQVKTIISKDEKTQTIFIDSVVKDGVSCSFVTLGQVQVSVFTLELLLQEGTVCQFQQSTNAPHHRKHKEAVDVLLDGCCLCLVGKRLLSLLH